MWFFYIMEYYSSVKKNEIWIDLETIIPSEVTQNP